MMLTGNERPGRSVPVLHQGDRVSRGEVAQPNRPRVVGGGSGDAGQVAVAGGLVRARDDGPGRSVVLLDECSAHVIVADALSNGEGVSRVRSRSAEQLVQLAHARTWDGHPGGPLPTLDQRVEDAAVSGLFPDRPCE